MKAILLGLLVFTSAFAFIAPNTDKVEQLLKIEKEFEMKVLKLKLEQRAQINKLMKVKTSNTQRKSNMSLMLDMECVQYADAEYNVTRTQAIELCKDEVDMECVKFADGQYNVSRTDAIKICKGLFYKHMECVHYADAQYNVSRTDAIEICKGGYVNMECVKYADAEYNVTRIDAIKKCKDTSGRGRDRGPRRDPRSGCEE